MGQFEGMKLRVLLVSCLLLPQAILFLLGWIFATHFSEIPQARKSSKPDDATQGFQQSKYPAISSSNSTILIQWRTDVFGWNPLELFGRRKEPFSDCLISNCEFIPRMNAVIPDVLLFHCRNKPDIPKIRFVHQKYIFITAESELAESPHPQIRGIFNLTMTYRLDSDIPIPYGRVENVSSHSKLGTSMSANVAIGKSKLAAWVASNCKTTSRREVYVAELRKYIPVDIYGKCGNLSCLRNGACFSHINSTYKFYLSFENSICEDYVTEKLYNIMLLGGIVPVVLGGANYSRLLPPHSVIDVMDFSSPRALATYLLKLDHNDTLYNEYFQWKKYYKVKRDTNPWSKNFWCRACSFLHSHRNQTKTYYDIHEWYNAENRCLKNIRWV